MMSATAALQVNLDAGPAAGWEQRLALVRAMVPMLVALSAASPYLGGAESGSHWMRQGTWQGVDHARGVRACRRRAGGGLGVVRPQRPGDAGP